MDNGIDCNIDYKCKYLKIREFENNTIKPFYSCNLLEIPLEMDYNFNLTCEINPDKPGFFVNPCEFKDYPCL